MVQEAASNSNNPKFSCTSRALATPISRFIPSAYYHCVRNLISNHFALGSTAVRRLQRKLCILLSKASTMVQGPRMHRMGPISPQKRCQNTQSHPLSCPYPICNYNGVDTDQQDCSLMLFGCRVKKENSGRWSCVLRPCSRSPLPGSWIQKMRVILLASLCIAPEDTPWRSIVHLSTLFCVVVAPRVPKAVHQRPPRETTVGTHPNVP